MPSPTFQSIATQKLARFAIELGQACEELAIERENRLRDENEKLRRENDDLRLRFEVETPEPFAKAKDISSLSQNVVTTPIFLNGAQLASDQGGELKIFSAVLESQAPPLVVMDKDAEFQLLPVFNIQEKHQIEAERDRVDIGYANRLPPSFHPPQPAYILDPGMTFKVSWDFLGVPVLMWDIITIPLQVFDNIKDAEHLMSRADIVLLWYWTVDLPLMFLTGYYTNEGDVVYNVRRIANNYMRGPFLLDLIIVLCDWATAILEWSNSTKPPAYVKNLAILRALRVSRFLRLARIGKLKAKVQILEDRLASEWYLILSTLATRVLAIVVVNHYICCGWYFLGKSDLLAPANERWLTSYRFPMYDNSDGTTMESAPFGYLYLTCLHWAIAQFTPGPQNIQAQNAYERLYTICVLIFGMVVFSSFVAAVTNARIQMSKMMNAFERDFWLLRKFCRQNEITHTLQVRMKRYLDFVIIPAQANVKVSDLALVKMLSPHLRLQLHTELHAKRLCAHPFLHYIRQDGQSVLWSICNDAISDWPLARGDVTFVGGQIANAMYVVTFGFLDYIPLAQNRSEAEIGVGTFVAEAVLWTEWEHQGQLQSSIECKSMSVDGAKFRNVILASRLRGVARKYGSAFCEQLNKTVREQGMPTDLQQAIAYKSFDAIEFDLGLNAADRTTKGDAELTCVKQEDVQDS